MSFLSTPFSHYCFLFREDRGSKIFNKSKEILKIYSKILLFHSITAVLIFHLLVCLFAYSFLNVITASCDCASAICIFPLYVTL